MKNVHLFIVTFLLLSCTQKNKNTSTESKTEETVKNQINVPAFQAIIDSADVTGAILIYNLQTDFYYANDFTWANKGKLPASTYKIPNSIIALETGVVKNDSTLFKWDGQKRAFKIWEQDLLFKDAFQYSCVPCYQEVARNIGLQRMKEHITRFNYGEIKVDSTTIDNFWLVGESKINQFQQIDFLKRFYLSQLPITDRTTKIIKNIMVIEHTPQYSLSGKTGWSVSNGHNGWFVGYVEKGSQTYLFATNIEPTRQFNMDKFPSIRKDITIKALKQMQIL
ncbi:OXA-48 family carbapenem-hydrolyzing class D beta-lactamase OXA-54 [Aquimarina addita]|uniref:beta-lactamase n=1 Tax=Aquimarina addita TaxID=870485 RepID=A0ABP6UQV0_9FLAO